MAKPQAFDCHDSDVSGADIFQKLVPMVRKKRINWNENNLTILGYTFSNVGIQRRKSEIITRNDRINRTEEYRIAVRIRFVQFLTYLASELFYLAFNWIEFH